MAHGSGWLVLALSWQGYKKNLKESSNQKFYYAKKVLEIVSTSIKGVLLGTLFPPFLSLLFWSQVISRIFSMGVFLSLCHETYRIIL